MTPAELTERITIQRKTTTADGQGGRASGWTAGQLKLWASVIALSMHEQLQAAAIGATVTYRVTVRYRADLTPTMRLSWIPYQATTPKTLEIHGVQPLEGGREWTTLDCAEVI